MVVVPPGIRMQPVRTYPKLRLCALCKGASRVHLICCLRACYEHGTWRAHANSSTVCASSFRSFKVERFSPSSCRICASNRSLDAPWLTSDRARHDAIFPLILLSCVKPPIRKGAIDIVGAEPGGRVRAFRKGQRAMPRFLQIFFSTVQHIPANARSNAQCNRVVSR